MYKKNAKKIFILEKFFKCIKHFCENKTIDFNLR